MNVVCVGDCGLDHYLPTNEQYVGGITANFARHARREFAPDDCITIVSCVGDDVGGDLVTSALEGSGIDCHISRLAGSTPVQYIEVEPGGEKNFVRYDEGVLRDFSFSAAQKRLIADSDLMVAPVYLQIVGLFDELMSIDTRGKVAIDFADFLQHPDFALLENHIERIDIAFFGLSVDDRSTIDRLRELAEQHLKLFVVTLGADGSRAWLGAHRFDCAAVPVLEVVDTTGAGDAFAAGFLSRHCHAADIATAMQHGARLAAKAVSRQGGGS